MENGSLALRISRLVFGALFAALGIWASAKIVLQLQDVNAPWPDWPALLFPAVPLAVGILAFVAAIHNRPVVRRPFLRQRKGPARVFGSVLFGLFFISDLLQRVFQQKTLAGVLGELLAAALVVGLLALLYGAINADLSDQEKQQIGK